MSRLQSKLLASAFAGIALFGAGAGRADDAELEALLSVTIESTSGKSATSADSAPALSMSISAEDLRRYGIRTLAEAYNYLVMGMDSEDPLGDPDVGARGVLFSADRGKNVLLLLDGHTLNDQESGSALHGHGLGLAIELIDHVEIVLGPGSVLYGANAMFGVINVITKRAKDFAGTRLIAEASFSPPLNEAHRPLGPSEISPYLQHLGHTYRVAAGAGYEFDVAGTHAELTAALEYFTLGGPSMMWAVQADPLSDYGPRGTFGYFGGTTSASYYEHTPSGYVRLLAGDIEASVHAVASRLSSPYVRLNDRPLDNTEFDDPDAYRDRLGLGLELKWHHNLSEVTSLQARLYADSSSESARLHQRAYFGCFEPFRPAANRSCESSSSGYARSIGTELQANLDWTRARTLITMLGADARGRRVGYENGLKEAATGQSTEFSRIDENEGTAAVYAQQVFRPSSWLTMNAGARWDFDSEFGNRISPRGAVIVVPWSGATLKGIYSEALRAPTTDERTYRDPQLVLPPLNLAAESVRSVEMILSERFAAQTLVFGVFRSWWSNMIVRRQLVSDEFVDSADNIVIRDAQVAGVLSNNLEYVFRYENVGSIDNWGFNGGWEGTSAAGRLAYGLTFTAAYTRSHTQAGPRSLTVTPRWFGNARLSYDLGGGLPLLAFASHFSGQRLADVGEDAGFARAPYAPRALDLKATATGPFPGVEGLSYQVMGAYSFAPTAPYAAGRSITGNLGEAPSLAPQNRFTALFGLQFSF